MKTKIITIEHKINFLVTVNIFLLIGKNVVIVDTGVKDSYELVLKKMDELNINKSMVSLILVTHSHPDHCLGITNMKKSFNAPVAVSSSEAPYLQEGTFSPVVPQNLLGMLVYRLLKKLHQKHDDRLIPDIVFEKELDLKKYGVNGKALLTPGHSIGGCSIIIDEENCIVGDLLIEDVITKKPRLNLFATDINDLKSSLNTILGPNISEIYSSHGKCWKWDNIQASIYKLIRKTNT